MSLLRAPVALKLMITIGNIYKAVIRYVVLYFYLVL